MHKSLLHKAKAVERKLNTLQSTPVNILENLGVNIARFDEDAQRQAKQKTCRKLFNQLLKTNVSPETLCQEFNAIAKENYQKNDTIKPHYLEDYAKNLKRLPYWYNAVAIDLLLLHQKNPLTFLPINRVLEDWIQLRKEHLTQKEAIELFKKSFLPDEKDMPLLEETINNAYEKGYVTDNV